MTNKDPNSIKDELRPLKDLLEIVKDKVDRMDTFLNVTMQQVRDIKNQQSVMNSKFDEMHETLEANTASVIKLESTVNGYGDMYKINDSNIRKMQKRLETMEESSGVVIPPELHLEDFSKAA